MTLKYSRRVLLILLAMACAWIPAQELALHDGDRVVFYGDSITTQRLYARFVEDLMLTRYPAMHVAFWNAGVPEDTVYGGYAGDAPARLKRDLIPHQPTVVTVLLGMVGKAERGPAAIEAIRGFGAVYLMAVGGAAYLVAKAIRASRLPAFEDLGMEAIYEFTVEDMPVTVAVDSKGTRVHHAGPAEWQQRIAGIPILQ